MGKIKMNTSGDGINATQLFPVNHPETQYLSKRSEPEQNKWRN